MDYEKQKETSGAVATFAWIGSGLYLYLTTPGASLFSWWALVFFMVGMFVAATVFGIAIYAIQRAIVKYLLFFIRVPTRGAAMGISALGWMLLVAEVVVIFFSASWVFHQIETTPAILNG